MSFGPPIGNQKSWLRVRKAGNRVGSKCNVQLSRREFGVCAHLIRLKMSFSGSWLKAIPAVTEAPSFLLSLPRCNCPAISTAVPSYILLTFSCQSKPGFEMPSVRIPIYVSNNNFSVSSSASCEIRQLYY